jgi:hypothetical protein
MLVLLRRLAVVLMLSCGPVLFQYTWHFGINRPFGDFLTRYGAYIAYFSWGMSRTYPIIGAWLASRSRLFESVSGWIRLIVYLIAANYGWAVGSALQDWLGMNEPATIPGAHIKHYGLASLLSVDVAIYAWLFSPMLFAIRRRLTERELSAGPAPRMTIRYLLGWTAVAAAILTTVRLLALYGQPLNLGIANMPAGAAVSEQIKRMPLQIVELVSIGIVMIGFSCRPKLWLPLTISAIVFRFAGEQTVYWITSFFEAPNSVYGIHAGPWKESLPFFAGSLAISIMTFAFARATGLVFTRLTSTEPPIEKPAAHRI